MDQISKTMQKRHFDRSLKLKCTLFAICAARFRARVCRFGNTFHQQLQQRRFWGDSCFQIIQNLCEFLQKFPEKNDSIYNAHNSNPTQTTQQSFNWIRIFSFSCFFILINTIINKCNLFNF